MTRLRQAVQLVVPVVRAASWGPAIAVWILAVAYVWAEARSAFVDERILVLRLAALVICLGAAYALDDPAETTVSSTPTPLLLRRWPRVGGAVVLSAAAWTTALVSVGGVPAEQGGPLPAGDLTLEAAAILVLTLCAAAVGTRLSADHHGGTIAAPIVLALVAVVAVLPARFDLLGGSPLQETWAPAHDRWSYVLAAALIAFVWLSRDRGRYGLTARGRGLARPPADEGDVGAAARSIP